MSQSVLIVEDNAVMANLLQFNLKRADFDVTVTLTGTAGLEKATNRQFDVIVTDYQLPGMNGAELCKSLRQLHKYQSTPIFLCTAKGLELDEAMMRDQYGVTELLFKPVSPRKLILAINELLATTVSSNQFA